MIGFVPKRILMTADTIGGVWTYSLELARGLAKHGVEVHLATMGALPTREQRKEASDIRGLLLHTSTCKLEWMDDRWGDVERAGEWLLKLEQTTRPDLIHLNGYAHAVLPWSVPTIV